MVSRLLLAALLAWMPLAVHASAEDQGRHAVETALVPPFQARGHAVRRRVLDARMRELRVPAVSIAVVRRGELAWAKAYGEADRSTRRPVSTSTRFQAASISKPVAALAAMALVERGVLKLDEDMNARLVTWQVPASEKTASRKVTLRRALSHAAGLSVEGFPGYQRGGPLPSLRDTLEGRAPANNPPVRSELWPGLQYRYSGGAYQVVEALVADVTRKPFADVVGELVLERAGMTSSTYAGPPRDGDHGWAAGHKGDGSTLPGGSFVYPELAAAGLWATPTDIARLGIELQRALAGRSTRLVTQATAAEMLSEQMKPAGLGFELRDGAARWFLHSGVNAGFQSLALFDTTGDGVVVMTNSDAGMILAHEIVATLAGTYGWTDYLPEVRPSVVLTADQLREYAGTYPTTRFGTIVVEARHDRLVVRTESRPPVEFFPESPRLFFPETPGFKARFERGWLGGIRSIAFGRLVVPKND